LISNLHARHSSLDINFMQQHIFNLMGWLNIGKAFSDIEYRPTPSRPLIISRCRMGHFINLWYPKSLFLSNFVLSLASLLIHHTTQFNTLLLLQTTTFDLVSFDLSYFLRQKAKKFQKVPFIFFCRSPSLPRLFTLRPLASIRIVHILALITILFFLWCV